MNLRPVLYSLVSVLTLTVPLSASSQSSPLPAYQASWIVLANHGPVSVSVEQKSWAKLLSLRPAHTFVLDEPLRETGKRKPRLDAGTTMIAMNENIAIACRLERPQFDYFVECVEDFDLDGRYDGYFLLNHDNPFLFSAMRQPRHQKVSPIEPVTLSAAFEEPAAIVEMVVMYAGRSALAALAESHSFQLCVLKPDVKNLWGDKAVARGCLPRIEVRDDDFPKNLQIYGRALEILAPVDGKAMVSISAMTEDMPVEL